MIPPGWQEYGKSGTFPGLTLYLYRTAMQPHQLFYHGQADTGSRVLALRMKAAKRLKDSLVIGWIDANSVVPNRESPLSFFALTGDGNFWCPLVTILDRI